MRATIRTSLRNFEPVTTRHRHGEARVGGNRKPWRFNRRHGCFSVAAPGLRANGSAKKLSCTSEEFSEIKGDTQLQHGLDSCEDEGVVDRVAPPVVYEKDFLSQADLELVAHQVSKLRKKVKKDHSFAHNRLSAMISPASKVFTLFTSQQVQDKLRRLLGGVMVSPADYPMEFRVYPVGAEMTWHKDDMLYVEPQYELIYTISNTSDSRTEWIDEAGTLHSHWVEPNSLIIVRAESLEHRVTPVKDGERSIVKYVYTTNYAKTPLFAEIMEQAPWRR
ncbi:hypothetical protein CYMTET_54401 [Cymbomonas tetramitiformis]|uniref:Uncharacterized protein n=1 Tax=Cymbomonas tetramitiformis TaxID=36881 RepID=A0AAE0BF15_9CHLO|nr:hypothetical protein CYMTET_54401 [Cymbomonas tetramitiformis]